MTSAVAADATEHSQAGAAPKMVLGLIRNTFD